MKKRKKREQLDLLEIFPRYRELKKEWLNQNLELDQLKLRIRKLEREKNEKENIEKNISRKKNSNGKS